MVEQTRDQDFDTIAAIATAPGLAGIGIVRISGPDALRIADELFEGTRKPSHMQGFEAAYGWVKAKGERIDEAIVLVMRGPKSYTRQDVVEFQCHGGPVVLRQVIEAALNAGARLAAPGEFTQRAFLAGRIDLAQAEAVASLVFAQTGASASAALRGLSGELGGRIKTIRSDLVVLLAELEAGLDFSEEELEFVSREQVRERLENNLEQLGELSKKAQAGMILSEGIKLVIAGKPNVGKSTLMNALLERDRVIVTPIPGTTRDVVEELIVISGVPVRLSDTAGIREHADEIEREGVRRSRKAITEADLILLILDASEPLSGKDRKLLKETSGLRRLALLNKIDRKRRLSKKDLTRLVNKEPVLEISAKKGTGLEKLRRKIEAMIWQGELSGEDALVSSQRQLELIKQARARLEQALEALDKKLSEEFMAAELRKAIGALGELTGATVSDEILELIFSKFCIGK